MAVRRGKIPKADWIALWGRAGLLCSFPGCMLELAPGEERPRLRGEMAHIVASSDLGPRGDPEFPVAERDRYGKLILLCPNHHQEVDSEETLYDIDSLRAMKSAHEVWVARQLSLGTPWGEHLSTTDYINVPRVLLDPASEGLIDEGLVGSLAGLGTLRDLGFQIGRISLTLENVITAWKANAISLDEVDDVQEDHIGVRVAFETRFRTKNMTGSDKQRAGFLLSGDLDNDPHIYVKLAKRKIVLPLDPRWVTTSTAFVTFTSGAARLAGIGQLRAVSKDRAIISPLAIGAPPLRGFAKEFDEMFSVR
jgi:hypothetical protein